MALLLLIPAAALKAQDMKEQNQPYRVVFQLATDNAKEHKALVKQLHNLREAIEGIEIEVVAHGMGVSFLQKGVPHEADIATLRAAGVKFLVCRNTLTFKKIPESSLLPQAEVIAAGLAHIIKRQYEGWAYIKAGF